MLVTCGTIKPDVKNLERGCVERVIRRHKRDTREMLVNLSLFPGNPGGGEREKVRASFPVSVPVKLSARSRVSRQWDKRRSRGARRPGKTPLCLAKFNACDSFARSCPAVKDPKYLRGRFTHRGFAEFGDAETRLAEARTYSDIQNYAEVAGIRAMSLALPEVDGFFPSLLRAFAFVVPLKASSCIVSEETSAQAPADAARSQ